MHLKRGSAKKKTVLISSASRGVGLSTAILLAKKGWTVFAGVRLKEVAEKLKENEGDIRPLLLDVAKPEQIAAAIKTVKEAVGNSGLDALLNSARWAHLLPMEFLPPTSFEYDFKVNVFGAFRLTRAAIPLLRTGTPGRIINVSSLLGRAPGPFASSLTASMHSLEVLSSVLRQELKSSGIKVAVIAPGPIKSNTSPEVREKIDRAYAKFEGIKRYEVHYGESIRRVRDIQKRLGPKLEAPPSRAAKKIKHMLETPWLRHRYCDTFDTWFMSCVYSLAPYWITERLITLLRRR